MDRRVYDHDVLALRERVRVLEAEVAGLKTGPFFCENGHHTHDDCTEKCSCAGQGKSQIEEAKARAASLEAALREIAETSERHDTEASK